MSENKPSSPHIKAAYIGGIFVVIASCVGGVFLLANTLLDKGFVITGPGVQVGNPVGETSPTAILLPSSTPQPLPISTSTPIITPPTPTNKPPELLGEWLYLQPRASMPVPASSDQVIFAHGDIDTSGTCHVREFGSGETVQGLGEGSFKLWLISGTPEHIAVEETKLQNGAAAHAGISCPRLP